MTREQNKKQRPTRTDFFKKLDDLYPLIVEDDLPKYACIFKKELIAALSNQSSSLPTILNPISKIQPKSGFGVALSLGGTNGYASGFRICPKGEIKFLNRHFFVLPENTVKNDLFHLMTKYILKAANGRKSPFPVGIGFAYPLKPLLHYGFIDGELLYMAKGRNIKGLVGEKVGEEFHKFLKKEYCLDIQIVVANDAICLLLGGNGTEVAGVVGTGLNFAYWDKREKIAPLKLTELKGFFQAEVAINIESKNFDKLPLTKLREIIDKKSDDRGFSLAEKETSGAYLYQIFNAGKDRLVGKHFPDLFSTDQLNDILTGAFRFPGSIRKEEAEKTYLFTERIFQRSAQVTAVQLCGILEKLDKTKGVVSVIMEGGIFWKARNYHALVNLYVNMILPEVIVSFARLYGSSRRGIAILANSK